MRAVLLTGHGGPERLDVRDDVPVPVPGPGEVLIRVAASSVNMTDVNLRTGWYARNSDGGAGAGGGWTGAAAVFPRIQGIDCCGYIAAAGPGVDAARVGERVLIEPCLREAAGRPLARPHFLGSDCDGAFAEYVAVPARHAFRVESPLADIELGTLPCAGATAQNLLDRAGVRTGERVLVTGASGGVGAMAVQLAAARGAEVIAQTGSGTAEALRALGAAGTIGRDENPAARLGAGSLDAVIDLVGGPGWPALLDALCPGGRYAVAGAVAGPLVALDLRTLYLKDLSLFGCTMAGEGVFARFVAAIAAGQVRPCVAATFPLDRLAEAQAAFLDRRMPGKIAIRVEG